MTEIKLTSDQQAAADAFFTFLMTEDRHFNISGTAGTGKTFLMGYLSEKVMENYRDACKLLNIKPEWRNVAFTATTNKAAEVLEHSLNKPVQTIHSYLNLVVRDDFRTGKSVISKTANWHQINNMILFIDECSMIDETLYSFIKETMVNCKIVYVGDHAQLAPVGETLSKIYGDIAPENFAVLREPVRNAGQPELVQLCAQLRETVETGVFRPIMPVPGVIEYINHARMEELLHEAFSDEDPAVRALCYTNERVQAYNQFIRTDVRGKPAHPEVGDIYVVASASTSLNGKPLTVEREITITEVQPLQADHRYDHLFPDGEPIEYHECTGTTSHGLKVNVRMPMQFERVGFARKALAKAKEWTDFWSLRDEYADLRDKTACTVYKSQGSTYDFVFVDLDNIGTSYDAGQVARMLFVAVSRARQGVLLYGSLPRRYQGVKAA